jgi:hypothetical protein
MRRTPQTETRSDVYQRITDALVQQLEQGTRPWMKPWSAEHLAGKITRPLRHNGKPYRGINVLMLWLTAVERGYSAPIWMTFKQAIDLGAHVRKGEKGTPVAYADTITRTDQESAVDLNAARVCHLGQGALEPELVLGHDRGCGGRIRPIFGQKARHRRHRKLRHSPPLPGTSLAVAPERTELGTYCHPGAPPESSFLFLSGADERVCRAVVWPIQGLFTLEDIGS